MSDPHSDMCYTLKNEHSGKEVILSKEHMRIIICALAGFELSREEKIEIRPEYLEILKLDQTR